MTQPTTTAETWKVYPLAPAYEVSDAGEIRRRLPGHGTHVGRQVSQGVNKGGYKKARLGKSTDVLVHRVVLLAHIGPPPFVKAVCNHKDGDKQNNHVSNLEWCSSLDNNLHAVATGLRSNPRRKTACPKGHPYTDADFVSRRGGRIHLCKICRRTQDAARNLCKRLALRGVTS